MTERPYFPLKNLRELMNTEFVNKSKIHCIKHIRSMTGTSIKEAKDFFQDEWLPFINGDKNPPKVVRELVSDSPEFDELARQVQRLTSEVQRLTEEVNELKSRNVKSMASGLFN